MHLLRMALSIQAKIVLLIVFMLVVVMLPRRSFVPRSPIIRNIENQVCVAIVVPQTAQERVGNRVVGAIQRMLRNACEPSRVSICVYDQGDSVKGGIPVELQSFVKVARNMSITEPRHVSDSDARCWIVNNMFRGERYFMSVPWCFEVARGWDCLLIDMLPSASSILTAQCETFSSRASFLALSAIRGSRLELVNRPCVVQPTRPVPSLFWVPCMSFSMSTAIVSSPPIGHGMIRNAHIDATLNGICLWTHGYDFFNPHINVVWNGNGACPAVTWKRAIRTTRPIAGQAPIGSVRTTRQYEAFVGVDLELKVATRRAYSGLTPTYDANEAFVKSGSIQSAVVAISSG